MAPLVVRVILALWIVAFGIDAARAHDPNLSGIRFSRDPSGVTVTVDTHASRLGPGDPVVLIRKRLRVRIDGRPFAPESAVTTVNKGIDSITWEARADSPGKRLEVLGTLYPENPQARLSVVVIDGAVAVAGAMLGPQTASWSLGRPDLPPESGGVQLLRWAREGILHIALGWDHLAFLLALLLAGGTLRALLRIVTAFTLAHSVTLAVAALGVWHPPSRWVEPLIALSVAVAAAANLMPGPRHRPDRRAMIAFGFGLLHGFGFAGALAEAGLSGAGAGWALAGFNAGVELGQAAVVVCAVPALAALARRNPQGHAATVRTLSGLLVAAGIVWTVQRLVG